MTDYSLTSSVEDAVPINSNEATMRSIQAHKGILTFYFDNNDGIQ